MLEISAKPITFDNESNFSFLVDKTKSVKSLYLKIRFSFLELSTYSTNASELLEFSTSGLDFFKLILF